LRRYTEEMVALFASMPALACLYMQGNPVVSSVRQYRKRQGWHFSPR
jgi:dynein assembly factor 1